MAFISQPSYSDSQNPFFLITAANSFWGSKFAVTFIHHQYQVVGLHSNIFQDKKAEKILTSVPNYLHLTSSKQLINQPISGTVITEIYLAQITPNKFSELQTDAVYSSVSNLLKKISAHVQSPVVLLASYRQLQPHKLNINYKFNTFLFQSTLKYLMTHKLDYRVVFIEDLVGRNMPLSQYNPLHTLIKSAISAKKISSLDYNYRIYPLHLIDAVQGIAKALFTPHTSGKNFLLAGKKTTLATAAGKIMRPRSNFDTKKIPALSKYAGVVDEQLIIETRGTLKWKPNYSSLELLNSLLVQNFSYGAKKKYLPTKQKQIARTPATTSSFFISRVGKGILILGQKMYRQQQMVLKKIHQNHTRVFKLVLASICILLLPFLIYSFYLGSSFFYAYNGFTALKKGDWELAKYNTSQAQQQFQIISKTQPLVEKIQQVPLSGYLVESLHTQVSTYETALTVLHHAASAGEETTSVVKKLFVPSDSSISANNFQYLQQLPTDLALLEAQLPEQRPIWLSLFLTKESYSEYRNQLPHVNKSVQNLLTTLPILESLSTKSEPITLAVMLQNNRELRPTGGFIGSFALVTFKSGTMVEKKMYDVYDADGQLKGYVKPPEPIHKYLGEASWYLRDSNWDPDFPTTAQRVQWFIEKELNLAVDGVIAIDIDAISNVLSAVGSLTIAEIPNPINHENISQYLQTEVEEGFFPGSHRKKYLLASITESLLTKFKNLDRAQSFAVAVALKNNVEQKHIQAWFADEQIQNRVLEHSWSGKITLPPVQDSNIIFDQLRIIEANLGVNKVNQLLTRTTQHTIDFSSGKSIDHTVRINYYNRSKQETKIEGTYKNYLRAYIPPQATFEGSLIMRSSKEGNMPEVKIYLPEPIDISMEHGWKVNGFLVTVPPESDTTVEIRYSLPIQTQRSVFDYSLNIPKQSGLQSDPYSFKIIVGEDYQLNDAIHYVGDSVTSLTTDTILTYNTELSTDQQLLLKLTPKF